MTATAMRLPSGAAVSFRQLEEDLAHQLGALRGPGEAPVARARMSNLVIYCDNLDQAAAVQADLPVIIAAHPARVLLLIGETTTDLEALTATAHVWSHAPASRQPSYTEQVTLQACGAAVERLPYVVRGLLVGDLPTNLWWAGAQPPPLAGSVFFDLTEPAQQVVYDSAAWADPGDGLAATSLWLTQFEQAPGQLSWRGGADLNWRRGKHWRRLIGQALDPTILPEALRSIREVRIEHGPRGAASAWLLASWLAARLDWRPSEMPVQTDSGTVWSMRTPQNPARVELLPRGGEPAGVRWLRIACTLHGTAGAINVVQVEERRLAIVSEGMAAVPRTITVRPQPLAELVGRQLSGRERDPIFDECLTMARAIAECARAG